LFYYISGKQLGFQANTNNDIIITPLSNGHATKSSYDDDSSSTISNFFSTLTSPFRLRYKPSIPHKKHINGVIKDNNKNSIYHQLDIETTNDENNNKTSNDTNQNSTTVHIPANYSNDSLVNPDNKYSCSLSLKENFLWIIFLTFIYFLWFILIAGISIVHVLIYSALLLLYLISDRTRRFALAILIYLTYLLLYDTLHLVPNYTVSNIHIEDVYLIEKRIFGIYKNGHMMTLNEYFQQYHMPFLDIFTGLCYLNW
jgi:hypothetical protein